MFGKWFDRIGIVIFGANSENDALSLDPQHVLLKCDVGFACCSVAQGDSGQAFLPDNAPPQCIVEVQHQTLSVDTQSSGYDGSRMPHEQRYRIECDGLL